MSAGLRQAILDRRFLLYCFGAFFLLRLLVLVAVPVTPTSDAAWYVARGLGIAAGEGYHEGPWPTAFWPVGFPAYLGAIFFIAGPHLMAAKLMNLVLSCGIFFLTYRIAIRIFDHELTARVALILLTIYPNQIAYTGVLFSEMLATFLLLLGIAVFIGNPSYARGFLTGLAFGFGALVKAQLLLIPGIMWLTYAHITRRVPRLVPRLTVMGALLALGMACVVLPWTARNYAVFHHFILISTNGGETFLSGNNPQARGDYTPDSPLVAAAHFSVADQVAADKRAYALGLNWIRNNPGRFLELIPLKIWRLWAPDGEGEWWYQRGFAGYDTHVVDFRVIRWFNQLYYAFLLLTCAAAVSRMILKQECRPPWSLLGVWLSAYITVISCVFSGQSRFHFPVMPWVMIYAGWMIAHWIDERSMRTAQA